MYFVYVLISDKDKNFYIGFTNNLKKRISEHKEGKSIATKHRLSIRLVYYEVCGNFMDAKARERYLKSGNGHKYLKKRLKHHLGKTQKQT